MKSPFPGMDPFIEEANLWGDFHSSLIAEFRSALFAAVPERYLIRSDYRSYHVVDADLDPNFKPVIQDDVVTMQAPEVVEHREPFINIYEDGNEQRPITVIEVLSPSNKCPNTPGWELYERKRQSLLMGGAHFVEIDLLRGGQKMPMKSAWPKCPYTLLVSKRGLFPKCKVWLGWSHKTLPTLPIPLLRPDPDIALPLQSLVETIYTRNRYHRSIDYSKPLAGLSEAETALLNAARPTT